MRETTNKYLILVHVSKAKLVCYSFATIYYSNVLPFFSKFTPTLLQFT